MFAASHTTISCTTVLVSRNHSGVPLQSHTYLNIPIPDVLLARRAEVTSILIGSLLSALQQQIITENGVSDDLARTISGAGAEVDPVKIATTRVPSFGNDMQDPAYGYRSLGTLSSVNVQMEIPSHTIQLDRELLAVQSSEPITKAFERIWAPLGLRSETHFIIIFTHFPRDGSLFSLRDFSSAAGSQSCQSSLGYQAAPSPIFSNPVNADWLQGLADASNKTSRTNSPASAGVGANHQQSTNSPARFATQFVQSTAPQDMPELTPGTSIDVVCRQYAISDDKMRSAMFVTTEKSLLSMVLNYQQMSHILSQLGLKQRDAAFIPSQTVSFHGGLVLSAGDVVKHFGWTAESFKHKSVWFGWAEDAVALQEWSSSPPGEFCLFVASFICVLIFVCPLLQFCSKNSGQLPGISCLARDQVFLGTAGSCEYRLFPRGGAE